MSITTRRPSALVRHGRRILGVAILAAVPASFTSAAPIIGVNTVQDLVALGSTGVTIGDYTFYDFSYAHSGAGSPTASQVDVETSPGPDMGLRFSSSFWSASNGANIDSLIRYKVHIEDGIPQDAIDGVGLSFDGTASPAGTTTFATVTETVQKLDLTVLHNFSVFNDGAGPGADDNSESRAIAPPLRDLVMSKDIQVVAGLAGEGGGTATIGVVDNTFHSVVPEPASLALCGLAAGALLVRRRRD